MIRIKFLFLLFIVTTSSCFLEGEVIRRAAFDFGSGKIKVQVADVDTDANEIISSVYTEDVLVPLSEDAASNKEGLLSKEIQDKAVATTRELKQKSIDQGAVAFTGVATEVYRKAPNGKELIDKYETELSIPVHMISQQEEGELGFYSLITENGLDATKIATWDIGGGSFQITFLDELGGICVYMGPFGRITAKQAIIKNVKKMDPSKHNSPNPMSNEEWISSLAYFHKALPEVPEKLKSRLKSGDLHLIGMAAHPLLLRELKTYCLSDIYKLLNTYLGKTDEEILNINKTPTMALTDLALITSILQKLNSSSVKYMRTSSGSTSGVLIMDKFWKAPL